MIRLGVNIDHVATVRNARGERYPDPLEAAFAAVQGGADLITVHLREDRRHIRDSDVRRLCDLRPAPINLEMALSDDIMRVAEEVGPNAVTLVPEKRQELTTEGGLDVTKLHERIRSFLVRFHELRIPVSLFVEPDPEAIKISADLGAHAVELHTGTFCHWLAHHPPAEHHRGFMPLLSAAERARSSSLAVHVGHGLNYQNAHWVRDIPSCVEANIGHAIVARALVVGLREATATMKALVQPVALTRP